METPPASLTRAGERTSDYPRDFLDNRFVALGISQRARGLAIDINLNPDTACNFNCLYCRAKQSGSEGETKVDVSVMAAELEKTLQLVWSGDIRYRQRYARLNPELLQLRHVALSGDGEPTLNPDFTNAVEAIVHVRARRQKGYFKLVLLTNGTLLDTPPVQDALQYFTLQDEIWIKLDAGRQSYMDKINGSNVPLVKVLQNAVELGRKRPIVIQSLFPMIDNHGPANEEIDYYVQCLHLLKNGGAAISSVQVYSANRSAQHRSCGHLSLQSLRAIAARVRKEAGLKAEVF